MIRPLLMLALFAGFAGQTHAQTTGTIVIYRVRGKSIGLIHYGEGEHPTIYCDDIRVAKMRESHKVEVSASVGQHICVALEKQYPGEVNVDSDKVSVDVKPNNTTYVRLQVPFGHLHFVLREASEESGSAEAAKMQLSKKSDSYTAVLPAAEDKKSRAPQ